MQKGVTAMKIDASFLIAVVYGIVETLEKFGMERKYAHLLAIPMGFLTSFLFLNCSTFKEYMLMGLLIGIGAVGTCDTICNTVNSIKIIKSKKSD